MNELFLKILNMSISAGWLVLVVLVLRLILRRAPGWLRVLLWLLVAVRLICPVTIESTWSLIPSAQTFPEQAISGPGFDVQTGIEPVDEQINGYLGERYLEGGTVSTGNGARVLTVLSVLWLTGIICMAGSAIYRSWRLKHRVETAVRYRDNIYQSENVGTPFVYGMFRPRIYLPFRIPEQELNYILAHEQAHIRRKDHWWKLLGYFLLTIYWFHPLLWVAYRCLCRDIELACDQKVIRGLGKEQRADYTQVLVNCSTDRHPIAAGPLAFGETGVRERVRAVMNYRKPAVWLVSVSILLCLCAAVCFLTNPVQQEFELRISIPAHSQEGFVFSHEEISPVRNSISVSCGKNLQDTAVLLTAAEETSDTVPGEPVYLTPGMSARIRAEKGNWYRIGVSVQNPTDQEQEVYIKVKPVEVRIEDSASDLLEAYRTEYIGDAPKVSAIAQNLPYPAGYSCSSIALQTEEEPYELKVFLEGDREVQEQEFRECAATAFDLVGNMGAVSFYRAQTETVLASFVREDF